MPADHARDTTPSTLTPPSLRAGGRPRPGASDSCPESASSLAVSVSPLSPIVSVILALAGLLATTGCYFEGGQLFSMDSPTYRSTTWQPKTVSVVDTGSGEVIWTIDVPVGEQVVLDFMENEGPGGSYPDVLRWQVMPIGTHFRDLSNRQPMPPREARRTEVSLRPAPEQPEDEIVFERLNPQPVPGEPGLSAPAAN